MGVPSAPRRSSSAALKPAVASSSSGDARVSDARIAHAAGITMSVSPRLTSRAAKTPTPPASGVSPNLSACEHPSPSSHARSAAPRSNRSTPSTDAIARGSSEIAMRDGARVRPTTLDTRRESPRRAAGGTRPRRDARRAVGCQNIGLDARRARREESPVRSASLPPSRLSRLSIRARLCRGDEPATRAPLSTPPGFPRAPL